MTGANRTYLAFADEYLSYAPSAFAAHRHAPRLEVWSWQLEALCRGLPSEVFYSPENERGGSRRRREEDAKKICRACAVLDVCRAYAVGSGEPYGVWGATTPAERQALRTL